MVHIYFIKVAVKYFLNLISQFMRHRFQLAPTVISPIPSMILSPTFYRILFFALVKLLGFFREEQLSFLFRLHFIGELT